jgi:hypothetical protein
MSITETQRSCDLPRRDYEGADLTDSLKRPGGTMQLRPIQSQALAAVRECHGLLGPIGVGWGKSLIALLSGTVLGSKLAIILTPASTVKQLQQTYEEMRKHFYMVPARILSYATLSQPKGTALLEELTHGIDDSDVVIVADECHRLKARDSARTKRMIRFLQEHPDVCFVALSGTITSKSLKDFAHLSELALRQHSPLPRDRYHLESWAECIDVGGRPGQLQWATCQPLYQWKHGQDYPSTGRVAERQVLLREAFQERLRTSPGVVCSQQGSLGCSLRVHGIDDVPIPEEIQMMVDTVNQGDITPDGEPISDDLAAWRVLRQLNSGFFYRLNWPGEPDLAWLETRREWHRQVRAELRNRSDKGYDSPFLVGAQLQRMHKREELTRRALHQAWLGWQGEKAKPSPPTTPVWVSYYLVDHAIEWASKQSEPVILWYDSKAVGEAFERRGIPAYGAGTQVPTEPVTCALSINAHGVGKNLQHYSKQLIVQPPSSGKVWEQLLGRTHRPGQNADEVEVYVYQHCEAFRQAVKQARVDARYIEQTSGNAQKLSIADFGGSLV